MNHTLYQFRLKGFIKIGDIVKMEETENGKIQPDKGTITELDAMNGDENMSELLREHGINLDEDLDGLGSKMFFCSCGEHWSIMDYEEEAQMQLISDAVEHVDSKEDRLKKVEEP